MDHSYLQDNELPSMRTSPVLHITSLQVIQSSFSSTAGSIFSLPLLSKVFPLKARRNIREATAFIRQNYTLYRPARPSYIAIILRIRVVTTQVLYPFQYKTGHPVHHHLLMHKFPHILLRRHQAIIPLRKEHTVTLSYLPSKSAYHHQLDNLRPLQTVHPTIRLAHRKIH